MTGAPGGAGESAEVAAGSADAAERWARVVQHLTLDVGSRQEQRAVRDALQRLAVGLSPERGQR
ncbi:MAG: hypothetical protein IPK37_14630 [Austwickia sp.]|nr:MAG: hypothetical protein IPK37_14630 [Austwickia sp.]